MEKANFVHLALFKTNAGRSSIRRYPTGNYRRLKRFFFSWKRRSVSRETATGCCSSDQQHGMWRHVPSSRFLRSDSGHIHLRWLHWRKKGFLWGSKFLHVGMPHCLFNDRPWSIFTTFWFYFQQSRVETWLKVLLRSLYSCRYDFLKMNQPTFLKLELFLNLKIIDRAISLVLSL